MKPAAQSTQMLAQVRALSAKLDPSAPVFDAQIGKKLREASMCGNTLQRAD